MRQLLRDPKPYQQFIITLSIAALVCVGLLGFGARYHDSWRFNYLLWNLFLAALPLVFAIKLRSVLRRKRWSDWEPLGWTVAWLLFLPNSFYMISDYIHLPEVAESDLLYNSVMFTAFICLGVILGFCSLYLIHNRLRQRVGTLAAGAWIGLTLLLSSYAIYLGRDLRWNSWDVVFNPAGLLFDVSDRLLRPDDYPEMFVVIFSFFVLLGSLYAVVWTAAHWLRQAAPVDSGVKSQH